MIEKITTDIKQKMIEAIKETIQTGEEYSFFICKDPAGNFSATSITKGTETKILMGPHKCPHKAQGNFHTHPDVSNIKSFLKDKTVSDEVAKKIALDLAKKEGIPITTPSHPDVLSALSNKCINRTDGTVCIGSDADPNRVDCWTATAESYKKCAEAMFRFQSEIKKREPPKKWIKPLFAKDIIYLK